MNSKSAPNSREHGSVTDAPTKVDSSDRHFSEIIRGGSTALVIKVIGVLAGQCFALLASRLYGADAWGGFVVSFGLLSFVAMLATLGMDTALMRMIAERRNGVRANDIPPTFVKALATGGIVGILVSILLNKSAFVLSSRVFNQADLSGYIRITSYAVVPLALTSICSHVLRAQRKIKEFAFFTLVARFLFGTLLLAVGGVVVRDPDNIAYAFVISAWIVLVLSLSSVLKHFTLSSLNDDPALEYSSLLGLSLPLLFASSMNFAKAWTDTLMLAVFLPQAAVGIYHVALKLATLTTLALVSVNVVAAPKFAELYGDGNVAELKRVAKRSAGVGFLCSIPIAVTIFVFPTLLLSFFGAEFELGVGILVILAAGQLVHVACGSVGYLLQMTGDHVFVQNVTIATAVLGVLLNYVLIPRWGMLGAAVATVSGIVLWNLACVLRTHRRFGFVIFPVFAITKQ